MSVDVVTVPFSGSAAGPAPLSWAQETTWQDIRKFLPEVQDWFVLRGRVPVPAGLCRDDVLDLIGVLVGRYEAVRTLLRFDGGRTTQLAVPAGSIDVTVVDVAADDVAPAVEAQLVDVAGRYFDHRRELPLWVSVVCHGGIPHTVVFGISHVCADMRGAAIFGDQLSGLLSARLAGRPIPDAPAALQPIALAMLECGPRGDRMNAAALAYLEGRLVRMRPSMFGPPVPHGRPRYRAGLLVSRAAAVAVRLAAARLRVSTSTVLLATTAALVRCVTGVDECQIALLCGNRFDPMLRMSVATLTQRCLASIPIAIGSFEALVRSAAAAALRAYRFGRYDTVAAAELVGRVEKERGVRLDLQCRFNDMWSGSGAPIAGCASDAARLPELVASTTVSWVAETDNDDVTFFVDTFGEPDRLCVRLLADTYRIPDRTVTRMLAGFERLVVALAVRDVPSAELDAVAELR